MPPLGSREWLNWFQQQDEGTQQQMLFDFGLSDANQPLMGTQGGFTPEIGAQSYGMLDQLSPPPVVNSKGVIQPSGTEQVQKQTNLFQDQLSLGTDNMLAAIAGQFAPTAFTPKYEAQGSPVQQTGLRQLQNLSKGGGWEGFMALQMLPTEYGGGGMTAGQAKNALKKALRATPDPSDQNAMDLHEELLGSLTPRYETTPLKPGETAPTKDLTTDQGLANAFDFSDVDTASQQWQSALANDPLIGYTDPQTGLSYTGAKAVNTPTMDWFDKYGLPYANKRYDDPDSIAGFQDATAPWAEGQSQELEDQQGQALLDANAAARGGLGTANKDMDVLSTAFNQATRAGVLKPATQPTTYTMGVPRPPAAAGTAASPVPTTGLKVASVDASGKPTMYQTAGGQLITPEGMSAVGNIQTPSGTRTGDVPNTRPAGPDFTTKTIPGTPGRDTFFMDVDQRGQPTGLSLNQNIPNGKSDKPVNAGGGLTGQTNFDFGAGTSTVPGGGPDISSLGQLMPFLKQLYSNRRSVGQGDMDAARRKVDAAKLAAAATVPGLQAATRSSDTSMARQLARGKMVALAMNGRTPLADTLAGRMMAARSAGVYG